jgi:hypothetical protein
MAKTTTQAPGQTVQTKVQVLTPALHNGKSGVPCIIQINATRYASDTPGSVEHAAEINEDLTSLGAGRGE